jgi:hypothetical protein
MTQARRREPRASMGVRVDKSRRHIKTGGVDDLISLHISKLPHGLNAVPANQYICINPRISTAV